MMGKGLFFRALCMLVLALLGCTAKRSSQPCRVESEIVLAETSQSPQAVALTQTPTGFFAVWSSDKRTFAMRLDVHGMPVNGAFELPAVRPLLDASGTGSKTLWSQLPGSGLASTALALAPLSDGAALAALVPGNPGFAFLCAITEAGPGPWLRLGESGPNATSIDVVTHGDRLWVAWHEGRDAASEIALVSVAMEDDQGKLLCSRRLERPSAVLSPALVSGPSGVLLAFAEVSRASPPKVLIHVERLDENLEGEKSYTVGQGSYLHPTVDLVASGNGFGLVFRDDMDDDQVPEYYHVALSAQGEPLSAPTRISQSDGFTGPRLAAQNELIVGAAIRSFQRNLLIGLNRFDHRGRKVGGELQIYADKTDFVRVDVAANEDTTLLVYGEDGDGRGRVLSSRLGCRP
jgi:hypothetical protein